MAYKFFTKRLLQDGSVDLASVFPEKQLIAKQQNNTAYGFPEIVDYLRRATEEFKFSDQKYIDMDNAIRAIMAKYYTSRNEPNPFEDSEVIVEEGDFERGRIPRTPAIVEEGHIRGKGKDKIKPGAPDNVKQEFVNPDVSAPVSTGTEKVLDDVVPDSIPQVAPVDDAISEPALPPVEPVAAPTATTEEEPSAQEILDAIEVLQFLVDDGDESAREAQDALKLLLP